MGSRTNSLDTSLRQRALAVVPGGMWGHMNAASLPAGYPQFFSRGAGSHVWDVDGNEYVDFMCSWGPVILGHHHPEVDEAAQRQFRLGDCLNGPGESMVELAETFVRLVPHASWVLFQKNGTDATTVAVTLARAGTRKRKILVARGAYHGSVPWCSPSLEGVTAEDRAHILYYDFNDIPSLEKAAAEAGDDLAGILVSAFKHDYAKDQELPTKAFATRLRELCDAVGAALILDDVRAAFRLDLGGSWENLGVRPDLAAYSKSIANGYTLAAVTGNERFREAGTRVFATGSFWCSAVAMAAGVATLRALERDDGVGRMREMGQMLRDGLDALSRQYDIGIRQTGPVQMPQVLFDGDANHVRGYTFCQAALNQGVYFHPLHNMFISAAHKSEDIARALDAAEHGFKAIRALTPAQLAAPPTLNPFTGNPY